MSLERGSCSLRRHFLRGRLPPAHDTSWLKGLKDGGFAERRLSPGQENLGWTVLGDELSADFEAANCVLSPFVLFSMRQDTLRVPPAVLRLHLRRRTQERMKALGTRTLSRAQLTEIKAEVLARLVSAASPSVRIVEAALDTASGELLVASTAAGLNKRLLDLVHRFFGLEAEPAHFMAMARRAVSDETFAKAMDAPDGLAVESAPAEDALPEPPESRLGASFLTWLLYASHTGEESWDLPGLDRFSLFTDHHLLLEGGADGSRQTLVRQGTASKCPELLRALQVGKQVSRMKLHLAHPAVEDEPRSWTAMLDRQHAGLAGLRVPKPGEADHDERRLERLRLLQEPFRMLEGLLGLYLEERHGPRWKAKRRAMADWIAGG